MDDQFGGRTDDDLFADEFEPVVEEPETAVEAAPRPSQDASSPVPDGPPSKSQPEAASVAVAAAPPPESTKPATTVPSSAPAAPAAAPVSTGSKGLAQSRHNKSAPSQRQPRHQHQTPGAKHNGPAATSSKPPATSGASANKSENAATPKEPSAADTKDGATQPTPPTGPSASNHAPPPPRNGPAAAASAADTTTTTTKPDREVRLKSGANPRTKLTEAELAAKMEQMRILSAEKTRRFEQAQRDETDHAIAYARGMEEARRRRAADDERRRRADDERRRMDDERARNRERKLAALGQREGGWDLGRDHVDEAEERRTFRSAHGGVRGARSAAGLGGSRFASVGGGEQADERRDGGAERGGRGRGRGRGGRGGRGGFADDRPGAERGPGNVHNGTDRAPAARLPPPPAADEFPALPSAGNKKTDASTKPAPAPAPEGKLEALTPLSPKVGGWDDEMAAMDAKQDA